MDATPIVIVFGLPVLLLVLLLVSGFINTLLFGLRAGKTVQRDERVAVSMLQPIIAVELSYIIFGLFLLVHFWLVGGPNKGISKQLLYIGSDRYLQMKVGLLLIIGGLLVAYLGRWLMRFVVTDHKKLQTRHKYLEFYCYLMMMATLVGAIVFTFFCSQATHQSYAGQLVRETCNATRMPVSLLHTHGPHEPCLSLATPYLVGTNKLAYYLSYILLVYVALAGVMLLHRMRKSN